MGHLSLLTVLHCQKIYKGGKMGIFELANGGTIFLDEIGEIGLPLQARLLRVIQEKEVMRLGGDRIYKFDARVISATNKDIAHMDDKRFRKDLLYRLKVFELKIPPLRERDDDVIEIFLFFLKHHINLYDYEAEIFKPVFSLLKNYTWPGNVRELQNVCERFCLYLKQTLHPSQRLLKRYIVRAIGEEVFVEDVLRQNNYSSELYKNNEKLFSELIATLKQCFDYNNEQIASVLGVSRTTLWRLGKNHLNS
jgi:propionate catabolism operon transcriptional regulator